MDKKSLSEADIISKFILPAVKDSGWDDITQTRQEVKLRDGKVIVRGNMGVRKTVKSADVVLYYKPNMPLAVIEAKANKHGIAKGVQQGLDYARLLDVPFVFASNGDGFIFHDKTAPASGGKLETQISLEDFPTPQQLWDKFRAYKGYTDHQMPYITQPFYAFSCTFINNLIRDRRVHSEMHGKPVFALFDFDLAYSQWDGLQGELVSNILSDGLVKKWDSGNAYAIMLPVPNNPDIQRQVIKDTDKQDTFGDKSCCEIEHIFYGMQGTEGYFKKEFSPGGELIKFSNDGEKVEFSESIVPALVTECFEIFRPIFEFIKSKIPVPSEAEA